MSAVDMDVIIIRLMQHARSLRSGISVMEPDDGDPRAGALLVRPTGPDSVELLRLTYPSEGQGEVRRTVATVDALDEARAEMTVMDRISAREREIARQRRDLDSPPSWSLVADRSAVHVLRWIGLDPADALNPPDGSWTRGPGGYEIFQHHPSTGGVYVVRRAGECRVTVMVQPGSDPKGWWEYDDTGGRPVIVLHTRMPMTTDACTRAVGRAVGETVVLPGCDDEARVRRVSCDPGEDDGFTLTMELESRAIALAQPPSGVATDWLRAA